MGGFSARFVRKGVETFLQGDGLPIEANAALVSFDVTTLILDP